MAGEEERLKIRKPMTSAESSFDLLYFVCTQKNRLLPVLMNNSVKQSSIPPRGSEVVTSDTYIAVSHLLGPQQKSLLGCHILGLSCDVDVRDLHA